MIVFFVAVVDLVSAFECSVVETPCSSCLLLFQVDKVVQMHETMMTRHTTMIVGPTGGGKSVVISTLCQAQSKSVSVYEVTPRFTPPP